MKAVTCHESKLELVDVDEPTPEKGQVVIDVTGCGICGSDLHARLHADEQADVLAEAGYDGLMRANQRVVMGHEFVGTISELGPGTGKKLTAGTAVVAMPLIRHGSETHAIGLSESAPGAFAERVAAEASLTFALPNGLAPDVAVLTEPMAIGYHAVLRAEVTKKDVAIVIGCGPVGLAVVCMLKAKGVRTVVASDFSPSRRALATACGADIVVDPSEGSPYQAAGDQGFLATVPDAVGAAVAAMTKMRALPVPWHLVWRVAEKTGAATAKAPVIFECVGVPGIIDGIITDAPLFSKVVVVGVCMQPDTIRPAMAINKQVDLRFVVGYTPLEFRDTLHLLADGKVDATPIVTGTVGLDGVAAAFDALADPEGHAKIVIDPASSANAPLPV